MNSSETVTRVYFIGITYGTYRIDWKWMADWTSLESLASQNFEPPYLK